MQPPTTFTDSLYAVCPDAPPSMGSVPLPDGGVFLLPPGSAYLPAPRPARIACLMETCDIDRQAKGKANDTPPAWWAVSMGFFSLGVTLGAVLGIAMPK